MSDDAPSRIDAADCARQIARETPPVTTILIQQGIPS